MPAKLALIDPAIYLKNELLSDVRHEYVAGSVYASPSRSRNHIELTTALTGILHRETSRGPCEHLNQDAKVWIEEARSYFYPDATISCPPNCIDDQNCVIDNPTVIFEVLLPTTANLDRGPKFAAYRRLASLRDYVLIDSETASVEVYSLEDDQWVVRFYTGKDAIASIPSVGLALSLAELYEHVNF
jgi:Uma2 family endonuclease